MFTCVFLLICVVGGEFFDCNGFDEFPTEYGLGWEPFEGFNRCKGLMGGPDGGFGMLFCLDPTLYFFKND